MMKIAVIDLGTNTVNLLVADRAGRGMNIVHTAETPVFLGQGGIEEGTIAPAAFERGIAALSDHIAVASAHGAGHIVGIGTSAIRSATNGAEFVRRAKEELGLVIKVITGDQEAGLIIDGARLAVPFGPRPSLVMDIGGGSIEFILATDKAVMWERSFELGVTRLRERFPVSDPMTMVEELRISDHLDDRFGPLLTRLESHRPHDLVGCSGSFDSLARVVAAERGEVDAAERSGSVITTLEFSLLKDRLMRLSRKERLKLPGLPEHRVDTIGFALIAIERVMALGVGTIRYSKHALKEGAAWRQLMGRPV